MARPDGARRGPALAAWGGWEARIRAHVPLRIFVRRQRPARRPVGVARTSAGGVRGPDARSERRATALTERSGGTAPLGKRGARSAGDRLATPSEVCVANFGARGSAGDRPATCLRSLLSKLRHLRVIKQRARRAT